jgi:hypothetical protein
MTLQHLTQAEFETYSRVDQHLSEVIDLLHGMDVHHAMRIAAEYENEGEILFHTLCIRLGLLVSAASRLNFHAAREQEQLDLDQRIKELGGYINERD